MSPWPTFVRTLREQRIQAIAWSVALAVLGLVHILMFPDYRNAASELEDTGFYSSVLGSSGDVSTPAGFLEAEFFSGAPLLVLMFAIIAGTGAIASERASGTLDLVLAQPVRRGQVVVEKTAALVLLAAIVSMASLPGLLLGSLFVDFELGVGRMALACLLMIPSVTLYTVVAVLGSAILRSRAEATIVTIGAALAGFFLHAFGGFASALEVPRKTSPFYWTDYGEALAGSPDIVGPAALLVVAGVLLVGAVLLFGRRDIGAGSPRFSWGRSGASSRASGPMGSLDAPQTLPTFRRTLREQRNQFAAWSAAVFLLAMVTVVIYPQFKDAFAAFDESGAFAELAGVAGSVASPAGYLNIEFFSYIPLLVLIAVVIAGTGAIASEEASGTLDIVLAQPVSRRRVLLEKAAALALLLAITSAASVPGFVVAGFLVDFEIDMVNLVLASLSMAPLAFLFLGLALFSSVTFRSKSTATIVVVGAAIAGYFLNTLGAYIGGLEDVRKVSPFYWADFSRVLLYGLDPGRTIVFLAIGGAFIAWAAVRFERRDLGTRGPSLLPWRHRT